MTLSRPPALASVRADELSFRWAGEMTPVITWHPRGEWHGGIPEACANPANEVAEPLALLRDQLKSDAGELTALLDVAGEFRRRSIRSNTSSRTRKDLLAVQD